MAVLNIYQNQKLIEHSSDQGYIHNLLKGIGINYEIWETNNEISSRSNESEIESLYKEEIKRVLKENNFSSFDIVSVHPALEGIDKLKDKFIPEHTHDDNEVRFFIDGEGLFCINQNDRIYQILCQKGDYIAVPAHTKHWFDMGSKASFKCIRFFESKEGWIAKYTKSEISKTYPLFDEFKKNN